jgi:hypothetical protein
MEHDLVTAAMGLPGNLSGKGMIGEDGKSQRKVQSKDAVNGGGITGDIVENDGETRAGSRNTGGVRRYARFGGAASMEQCLDCRLELAATG